MGVTSRLSGEAARRYGLVLSDIQRENPKLLHAPVAAEEVRRELGVVDPDVYEAILWHTTGRPGLCTLGLALYLADFSEPARTHPEAAAAREVLGRYGFTAALLYVSEEKMKRLRNKSAPFDPATQEFHSWLREKY